MEMEIMFDDLTEDAQERLLNLAGVSSPEEMEWDTIPVAVVELDEGLPDEEEEDEFDGDVYDDDDEDDDDLDDDDDDDDESYDDIDDYDD